MLVYIVLLLICIFFACILDRTTIKTNRMYRILSTIPFFSLFLISAIRYKVGTDYVGTYVRTFNLISEGASNIRCDVGFLWLNKIIIFLELNVQWVFIITSFIINFFIAKTINNKSKNKMLSYYIYICGTLYFFSMNGVRQVIAISLFYYSLKYIEKRNLIKYLIINIIGFLFHNTAIIFIPMYFLFQKEIKISKKIIILVLLILFSSTIMPIVFTVLEKTKYSLYINNAAFAALNKLNFSTLINFVYLFAYDILIKKKDKEDIIYSNCHFMAAILSLFITVIPLALRIFMAFRFIEFLSVPNLISKLKVSNRTRYILIFLVLCFYFAYFFIGVAIENGNDVLPYRTIFE